MATYRLIHQQSSTGARSSSLDDLMYRVWVQYMLSADDYGVCPAVPAKFQGDNPRLAKVSTKKLREVIAALVMSGLVQIFEDGENHYLYQHDWQDWQRLKHFTATTLPAIPEPLLAQCSEKTRAIFNEHPARIKRGLPPHAGARDAHAHASASADAPALADAAPRKPLISGLAHPATWGKVHGAHVAGFCEAFVCLPESVFEDFTKRVVNGGATPAEARAQVMAWAQGVKHSWQGQIPGDDIFEFWRHEWKKTHGSNKPATGSVDVLAGLRS